MTIKEMRKKKGLLQGYVAEQLGISQRHYQKMENEGQKIKDKYKKKMAKLFGCKLSQICDDDIKKEGEKVEKILNQKRPSRVISN